MKTTIITTSATSTTGYELVIKNDDGSILNRMDIETIVDEGKTLKLPENPSNRKFFSIKKIEEAGGTLELTHKESIKIGERSSVSKSLEDYMTDEEKKIIDDIKKKAEQRREDAKKKAQEEKNDPVKKAEKKVHSIIESLKKMGMSDEAIQKLISSK